MFNRKLEEQVIEENGATKLLIKPDTFKDIEREEERDSKGWL